MIPAQYFDIPGLVTFTVLIILGATLIKKDKTASTIIIIIGILGLMVDAYNVFANFLI